MITVEAVIAAQDASRAAHQKFLDFPTPATAAEGRAFDRAFTRSLKLSNAYCRCVEAYIAQQGMGKEVYAHIEAERERLGRA